MVWFNGKCFLHVMNLEMPSLSRVFLSVQSFPRSVLLDEDKKQLIQWPIEEVEELHGEKVTLVNKEIESGSVLEIGGVTASQVWLLLDFDVTFQSCSSFHHVTAPIQQNM